MIMFNGVKVDSISIIGETIRYYIEKTGRNFVIDYADENKKENVFINNITNFIDDFVYKMIVYNYDKIIINTIDDVIVFDVDDKRIEMVPVKVLKGINVIY